MRILKKIGWVLARPFVWWMRLWRYRWTPYLWCGGFALNGALAMDGFMRWFYPLTMLVTLLFALWLRRLPVRFERRVAVAQARAAGSRADFLATMITRDVPVPIAQRVVALVEQGRMDEAMALVSEYLQLQQPDK